MMTFLIIILIISIVGLLALLYFDPEFKDLIVYLLMVIVIFSMGIGFNLNDTYTVKKPLVPSLEIKCTNGKCDTSYVYKLNR